MPAHLDVSDVHVIANQENATEYVHWTLDENPETCGGFDRGNVINDGAAPDGARAGPAGDLLAALERAIGYDDHLLVIDGDHVPEPNLDIGVVVDRAPREGAISSRSREARPRPIRPRTPSRFAWRAARTARRSSTPRFWARWRIPGRRRRARRGVHRRLGSRPVSPKGDPPVVSRFFEDVGDLEPAHQSLGRLVAYLRGKTSMRAMEMKHVFPLKTLAEYERANALFRFYAERREEAERAFGGEGSSPAPPPTRRRGKHCWRNGSRGKTRGSETRARAPSRARWTWTCSW